MYLLKFLFFKIAFELIMITLDFPETDHLI